MNDAERAEDSFFEALRAGDADALEDVLADDFLIVDVLGGSVADRQSFVGAVRERLVEFDRVELVERVTRLYGDAAIVVGRTEMSGSFAGSPFGASSRYTHVLVRDGDGRFRLATAQGTRIADA